MTVATLGTLFNDWEASVGCSKSLLMTEALMKRNVNGCTMPGGLESNFAARAEGSASGRRVPGHLSIVHIIKMWHPLA
jgi:hypothetical protein